MPETRTLVATLFLLTVLGALPALAAPPAATTSTALTQAVAPAVVPAIAPAVQSRQCTAPAVGVDDPLANTEAASAPALPSVDALGSCNDKRCLKWCVTGGTFVGGVPVPCICCG